MKTIIIKAGQGEGESVLAESIAKTLSKTSWKSVSRLDFSEGNELKQGSGAVSELSHVFRNLSLKNNVDVIVFDDFSSANDIEVVEKTIRCGFSIRHLYERTPERINSEMTLIFCLQDA